MTRMSQEQKKTHELTHEEMIDKFSVDGVFVPERLIASAQNSFVNASQTIIAGVFKYTVFFLVIVRKIRKIDEIEKRLAKVEREMQNKSEQSKVNALL